MRGHQKTCFHFCLFSFQSSHPLRRSMLSRNQLICFTDRCHRLAKVGNSVGLGNAELSLLATLDYLWQKVETSCLETSWQRCSIFWLRWTILTGLDLCFLATMNWLSWQRWTIHPRAISHGSVGLSLMKCLGDLPWRCWAISREMLGELSWQRSAISHDNAGQAHANSTEHHLSRRRFQKLFHPV